MKKIITFLAIGILTTTLTAQKLPKTSPSAKVNQVVGLTDFLIDYSRPSVKGRTIFGDLVPYNEVWRLGANECTKLTSSTDFTVGGKTITAGTYSIYAVPTKSGNWTIAINTDIEQWGSTKYDTAKNIVTVEVKAVENSFTETLVIGFNNLTAHSGVISIKWENLKIDVPFTVNTDEIASKNISDAIDKGEKLGDVYNNAASYYMGTKDYSKANMYIEKSIALEKNYKNVFVKAKILNDMGKKDEAIKLAEEAVKMAEKAESKGWANYIKGNIEEWRK